MNKKVLIITYYWPPAGGIGVQRWLKFVKNFRENGWEPIIYTADSAKYPIEDAKLTKQIPEGIKILKQKVPEPNNILSNITFWRKDKSKGIHNFQQQEGVDNSIIKRLLWFIRGNFFIPDARFLWIKPSVKYLKNFIKNESVDAIISTGPPHSVHLIAKQLKDEFNIPWVSDFRDPWTSMDYLKKMSLTNYAKKKHIKLEKLVLENSSKVVVVGNAIYQEFKDKYNVESKIIFNGYDSNTKKDKTIPLDEKFTIVHVGSFLFNRNCNDLWKTLSELINTNKDFSNDLEIKLVGNVAPNIIDSINKFKLNNNLNKIRYVEHEKAVEYQSSAQVLLLPIDRIENAEFVITGKMFEYLKSKRPILLIAPKHGDATKIIADCNAGYCCDFNDNKKIKESILEMYNLYKEGLNNCKSKNIEQYSMQNLTKEFSELLNLITKK